MCNVKLDDILRIQLALLAEMGGLVVSSASLLALSAFLASAFGASDFPTTIFSETFDDVSFTKALEKWLSLTNDQESPLDGVTMIPWEMGKQLLMRDVMVVDALAHSRLNQGSLCNPATTATEAEARKLSSSAYL